MSRDPDIVLASLKANDCRPPCTRPIAYRANERIHAYSRIRSRYGIETEILSFAAAVSPRIRRATDLIYFTEFRTRSLTSVPYEIATRRPSKDRNRAQIYVAFQLSRAYLALPLHLENDLSFLPLSPFLCEIN